MAHFPKPFFKKGRGVWYVEINRKQINLGPNRKKAFQKYHELMAKAREAPLNTECLAVIVDAFLSWVKKNRSPETFEWYRYRLQRFIDFYPDMDIATLRPYHVERWVDSYSITVTTRRNYFRSIKRCLKWAQQQGYTDKNPIAALEVPRAEHREVAMEEKEFQELLSFICNSAFRDLVVTTWETGCRPQESLRVEARHVDTKNQRWVFPISESKMKRCVRVVYLTDTALAITKRLMHLYPTGPLFRNKNGIPWTTDAVNCAFSAIQVRMGKQEMNSRCDTIRDSQIIELIPTLTKTKREKGVVRDKRPAELREEAKRKLTRKRACELATRYSLYALRHSWATNALKRGVDPLTVAILMGHKDPSTLARVYQHLSLSPEHLLAQTKKAAG